MIPFAIIVFVLAIISGSVLALTRKTTNLPLTAKLIEDKDLSLDDLDPENLKLVNTGDINDIYCEND